MSADFFLKIEGVKSGWVKGETLSQAFQDWIQVKKWHLGADVMMDSHVREEGPTAARGLHMDDVEFEAPASIASPALFQMICTNETIKAATLSCRKAAGSGKEWTYITWKFHGARVSAYKMVTDGELPVDIFSLRFTKVEIAYYRQTEKGSMDPARTAMYGSDTNQMETSTLK